MPIILEDTNTSIQNSNSAPTIQLSPKEYNSILTGNGINQGLLKNSITTLGTLDTTPNHIISLLKAEAHTCNNKSHHVHDDTRNYTILHQDISLCGGYAYAANAIAQFDHRPSYNIQNCERRRNHISLSLILEEALCS